ncbi:hypothetical protein QYF61_001071 [Mycteria americana]|uniref:Core shell protein Gag P30 domain-containing protein n=1 Tax=Mycteria americana TaxID=33587 RepID=A0AAN7RS85_MYCAM|nr:hypothetical protein QYF61_001071 [Mycteria americana]
MGIRESRLVRYRLQCTVMVAIGTCCSSTFSNPTTEGSSERPGKAKQDRISYQWDRDPGIHFGSDYMQKLFQEALFESCERGGVMPCPQGLAWKPWNQASYVQDPQWDPNTSEGLQRVKEYQKVILYGIQHGVQKPKNLSELYEVTQGDKETPSAFYERLCEVARKWTDLDP